MNNRVVGAILLLVGSVVHGTWKVGTITNASDIILESAWYVKPQLTQISYLTTLLQNEKFNQKLASTKPVSFLFNYTVSQAAKGHCIIKAEKGYQLMLDDNPTHFVKTGRAKVKKKGLSKNLGIKKSYGNLAQVYLELVTLGEQPQEMKYAVLEYEQDNQIIDIILSGSAGNYAIQLKLVPLTLTKL